MIRNLQFYVYDVELRGADGEWRALELDAVPAQQSNRVALVDIARSPSLQGRVRNSPRQSDGQAYTSLRFTLGVPFDLNHANPLTAKSPLDRGELFWSWRLGYKFFRADLAEGEREGSFHLGSTGCASASSVRPPASPCAKPNRMRVQIDGFDPAQTPVYVRMDALIEAMRAADFQACTGDYAGVCEPLYSLTGLDSATGACSQERCREQRLFAAPRSSGS